jgi:hypothetical protein
VDVVDDKAALLLHVVLVVSSPEHEVLVVVSLMWKAHVKSKVSSMWKAHVKSKVSSKNEL